MYQCKNLQIPTLDFKDFIRNNVSQSSDENMETKQPELAKNSSKEASTLHFNDNNYDFDSDNSYDEIF